MTSPIHLIGLPTDHNSSFERGTASAPAFVREALWSDRGNMATECGLEVGVDIDLVDIGDLTLTNADNDADDAVISAAVSAASASDAVPLLLGGDHAVSYPVIAALAATHGPLNILHFDAHPDTYDDFRGNPRSHASPFARIMEAGLARRLVQVGIRTATPHQRAQAERYDDFEGNPRSHASPFARIMEAGHAVRLVQVGIRTLNRHCREQAERFGVEIMPISGFTPSQVPVLSGPLYISVDLDGIDPSEAPGVSHPEPGGLRLREVLDCIAKQTAPIVGADIVELNPARDVGGVTAILAAKLVREVAAQITLNTKGPA